MTDRPAPEQPGSVLTAPDHSEGVDIERDVPMLSAISNAMVGLKKQYYGKGPSRARTFINENYVFCVLEGGLTRNEETLLEAGKGRTVRDYRLEFQETMTKATTEAVEQITGRRVLTYNSQMLFDPARSFEIFVLDEPPG